MTVGSSSSIAPFQAFGESSAAPAVRFVGKLLGATPRQLTLAQGTPKQRQALVVEFLLEWELFPGYIVKGPVAQWYDADEAPDPALAQLLGKQVAFTVSSSRVQDRGAAISVFGTKLALTGELIGAVEPVAPLTPQK